MAESHVSDEAYLDTYEYIIFNMLLRQEVDAPSSLSEYVPFSPDDSEPMAIGESTILENTVSNLSLVDIDPQVKDLRESARALYLKANDIYIKTEGHKTRFIQILSGKRTVREQAELYEKYLIYLYDGPPANKANKPGKSFHEYGLAIDVIRNGDDSRLTPALESAGWVQAIADEGWHFQAESASDWGEIVKRMESEVSPLSNKYAENRVVYYENKKRVLASEPEYMNERRRLAEVALGLNSEKKNINITRDRLQKEQQELKQGDVRLKNQRLQVQQLKQQYTTMVYDRCPIGKPYNECTHTDLKLAFDKEKMHFITDTYLQRGN